MQLLKLMHQFWFVRHFINVLSYIKWMPKIEETRVLTI